MPAKIKPEKQASYLTVRLPDDLRLRLEAVVKEEDRTASATARRAIEAYVTAAEARRG